MSKKESKSQHQPKDPAATRSRQDPKPQINSASVQYCGLGVILVLLALIVLLFSVTRGALYPAHWTALYVAVALIAGLSFWLFAPGSWGEYSNTRLGIRLGGGAAVGAAFMLLAQLLTPDEPPAHRIVNARIPGVSKVIYADRSRELSKVTPLNEGRFLVEFNEREQEGTFSVKYIKGSRRYRRVVTVPRIGELPKPKDQEEGELEQ